MGGGSNAAPRGALELRWAPPAAAHRPRPLPLLGSSPPRPLRLQPAARRVASRRRMEAAALDLTSETLGKFAPGRFFRDASAAINSLDFHRTEDLLVCAGARALRRVARQLRHGL